MLQDQLEDPTGVGDCNRPYLELWDNYDLQDRGPNANIKLNLVFFKVIEERKHLYELQRSSEADQESDYYLGKVSDILCFIKVFV